jgi:hypothetical protein
MYNTSFSNRKKGDVTSVDRSFMSRDKDSAKGLDDGGIGDFFPAGGRRFL